MGEWIPGAIAIGILILIGVIFPITVGTIIDLDEVNQTAFMNATINFVDDGVVINSSINPFDNETVIDPFAIPPEQVRNYTSTTIQTMGVIPQVILIPLLVIMLAGLLYTLITMFLP